MREVVVAPPDISEQPPIALKPPNDLSTIHVYYTHSLSQPILKSLQSAVQTLVLL